ncbi:hypothetical protein MTR67_004887 [Solanum verrucosum]|uniref:Water stress and hypersensitive response domain-containing protein n=1 Tax=Solanum verrucosum TaxID=315347 RepID=A0AAF0PV97_SOLVR|nr:desiccation protectant protein Lea14 homolog [Solanum verrucosum]WMV11502.1 hypothetical protein MTR67_004887 [Solanum verrucosum]
MADFMEKAMNFVSEKVGNMEKPEADITDFDLKKVSMDSISYHAKVAVKNPYSVPVPIMQISYTLKCSGRVIVSGTIPDPGNIKANDTTILDVPVKVPHSMLVSLGKDIGKDWDIDYKLELGLAIDLPVIGNFTIPLSHSGEIKLPSLSDLWNGDKEEDAEKEI